MGQKTTITIALMRKEDIDQVLAIEQASFSMPWSKNLFLSEFRSASVSSLMVALADGPDRTVIGYIVCWLVEDEMHLLNLAVAPAFRREGVARKLVLAALKRAYSKGAKRAFLEVRASNDAAQKLYSDIGFTGTSLRRDYYDMPPEDAVIMILEWGTLRYIIEQE
jgi:ribosomal-protein-alanine N-acetyltransferase